MTRSDSPIYVVADDRGTWHVHHESARDPLSKHGTGTDAERAAVGHAKQTGATGVVVRDRYGRLHHAHVRP